MNGVFIYVLTPGQMSVRGGFLGVWVLLSCPRWRKTNTHLAPPIMSTFSFTINSSIFHTMLQTFYINVLQWRAVYFLLSVPFPKQRIKVEQTALTFTVMKILRNFTWLHFFWVQTRSFIWKIVKMFIISASFTFQVLTTYVSISRQPIGVQVIISIMI